MPKKTRTPTQTPKTPPNNIEAPGAASNTPVDGEEDYWIEHERFEKCIFGPDEQHKLLCGFYLKLDEVLSEKWANLCKDPDFRDDAWESNPKFVAEYKERHWLQNANDQIEKLARKHGLDPRPLYWFNRFLRGCETLSDMDKRGLRDLVSQLESIEIDRRREKDTESGNLGASKSDMGQEDQGERERILLDKVEVAIMGALTCGPYDVMFLVDIAENVNMSGKKVRSALARLTEVGFVCRPKDRKKGYHITEAGRADLQSRQDRHSESMQGQQPQAEEKTVASNGQ